jgi:hypothetical protein
VFSVKYNTIFENHFEIFTQILQDKQIVQTPRNLSYNESTLVQLKLNDEFISNISLKHTKILSKTPLIVTASSENHFNELLTLLNSVEKNATSKTNISINYLFKKIIKLLI